MMLEFPVEKMQFPMNYFELECCLSFKMQNKLLLCEYIPIQILSEILLPKGTLKCNFNLCYTSQLRMYRHFLL